MLNKMNKGQLERRKDLKLEKNKAILNEKPTDGLINSDYSNFNQKEVKIQEDNSIKSNGNEKDGGMLFKLIKNTEEKKTLGKKVVQSGGRRKLQTENIFNIDKIKI